MLFGILFCWSYTLLQPYNTYIHAMYLHCSCKHSTVCTQQCTTKRQMPPLPYRLLLCVSRRINTHTHTRNPAHRTPTDEQTIPRNPFESACLCAHVDHSPSTPLPQSHSTSYIHSTYLLLGARLKHAATSVLCMYVLYAHIHVVCMHGGTPQRRVCVCVEYVCT